MYSVIGTLTHRAKVVSTDPDLVQSVINHLRIVLGRCNYPNWAISKVQNKVLNNNQEDNSCPTNPSNNNNIQDTTTQSMDNNSNTTQNNRPGTNQHGNARAIKKHSRSGCNTIHKRNK